MNKPVDYEQKPFHETHLVPQPSGKGVQVEIKGFVSGWPDGMKTKLITEFSLLDIDGEALFKYEGGEVR